MLCPVSKPALGQHSGPTPTSMGIAVLRQTVKVPRSRDTSGSLLIRDVEVQAAACRDRVDQGLQLWGRGRLGPCLPPALQCDPGGSQARTARSAHGQDGAGGGMAARGPPLSTAGLWPRCGTIVLRRVFAEPGVPAEAERAVDQGLAPADGGVGADLEVGPAQLVFDLFVALLDPVPDAVDPGDLGQVRRRVSAGGLARAASRGLPGRGRFVARYQVAFCGRVPGSLAVRRPAAIPTR
jgi:hypothetical protein